MTSRDFCYWLQGFYEINGSAEITAAQSNIIKRHLNMVFKHEIDPSFGDDLHQAELSAIHEGTHLHKTFSSTETPIRC